MNKSSEILKSVDMALDESETGDICTETSFARPDDKIYLMP